MTASAANAVQGLTKSSGNIPSPFPKFVRILTVLNEIEQNWMQLNKIEQNWTKLNKTEQNWTKLNEIEWNLTKLKEIEQDWTKKSRKEKKG